MEEGPLQKAEGQTEEEAVHVKGALTQRWKRLPLLRISRTMPTRTQPGKPWLPRPTCPSSLPFYNTQR